MTTQYDEINDNRDVEPDRRWCGECGAFRYDDGGPRESATGECPICGTPFETSSGPKQ